MHGHLVYYRRCVGICIACGYLFQLLSMLSECLSTESQWFGVHSASEIITVVQH